jgi:hypothetical protein
LSPDDTSNQITLRFSRQRKTDAGPVNDDVADVPLLIDRQKYLAMNPLAAAKMFKTLVEHCFTKLFGMSLAHQTKSSKFPPGKRPQGALGTIFDSFIIFETQGRGSLHFHAIIWAGIPCQTFSVIAESAELTAIAAQAIDAAVCASLEPKYHDEADNTGVARRRARMGGQVAATEALRPVFKFPVTGCPGTLDDFLVHAHSVAASCQVHYKHYKTCQSGKVGKRQCRMAQPQKLRDEPTGPVQVCFYFPVFCMKCISIEKYAASTLMSSIFVSILSLKLKKCHFYADQVHSGSRRNSYNQETMGFRAVRPCPACSETRPRQRRQDTI